MCNYFFPQDSISSAVLNVSANVLCEYFAILIYFKCNFKGVSYLLKIAWFLLCRSVEVFDGKQRACVLRQKEVHITATAAQSELRLRHSRADDAKAYSDQSAQVSVQISRRFRHLNKMNFDEFSANPLGDFYRKENFEKNHSITACN